MITILYSKNDISDVNIEINFSNYVKSSGSMESFKSLSLGVQKKHPKALYYTALIFEKHIFMDANKSIAKKLYEDSIQEYRKSSNKDIVYPLHRLGMLYVKEKNYLKGIQLLKESSDLNFYKSTNALIVFFEKEYFNSPKSLTKEKLKTIVQLYKKLLKSKEFHSKALVGLARWYMNSPYDDFINYNLSLKYSLEAANEYHENEAYANLVTLYRHRSAPFKNINKSYYWQALYLSEAFTRSTAPETVK
jgi:hypothetical protein